MSGETNFKIKVGNVSVTVYPWRHRSGKIHWRFSWTDQDDNERHTTRANKSEAKLAARERARMILNETCDFSSISAREGRLCRAFLDLKPTWAMIERLRAEQERELVTVSDAFDLFMESKEENSGNSPHNVRTLRNRVGHLSNEFPDRSVSDLTVSDLDQWLARGPWEPSTKLKIRAAVVTFFRWCRLQGILQDVTTAADKMARPIVSRKAPTTYSPSELSAMLTAVRPEFRLWLAISAWAGVRSEELYPHRDSDKGALSWEDIDLDKKLIIVPREVSKTNERRIIPICPALLKTLEPLAKKKGRITGMRSPSDRKHADLAETLHLGAVVGGWRNNALRHSFVSYRCAVVGPSMAALEAGNTEGETRRSYLDAKSEAEAREWFSVEP